MDEKLLGALLQRMEAKLDKLDERLDQVDKTALEHKAVLNDHTRRSTQNEEALALLRSEVEPLKAHVALWGALGKAVGALGTLVGVIAGVLKLLEMF